MEPTTDHEPFPNGARVLERAYPDSPAGTVTGHAPDGWTFVAWPSGAVLSHRPGELIEEL